jgi:hypothetical protein
LVVGAAHVAVSDKGAAIEAGSDRTLTFGGHAKPVKLDWRDPGRLSMSAVDTLGFLVALR